MLCSRAMLSTFDILDGNMHGLGGMVPFGAYMDVAELVIRDLYCAETRESQEATKKFSSQLELIILVV